MSEFTKFSEKPRTVEAAYWDGTLEGAGPILKEIPGLAVISDGNELSMHIGNEVSPGPSYVYREQFSYRLVSAERFRATFEEAKK